MPPSNRERAAHILDAISRIDARLAGVDEATFAADDQLHDSVLYQLARLGEAANRLDSSTKGRYPEVPWDQIRGFRNRVLHEYHNVSLRIVWNTIQADLPHLRAAMEREVSRDERHEPPQRGP